MPTPAIRRSLTSHLLVAGAILHDLGKTRELGWERGIDYTTEGRLVGHLLLDDGCNRKVVNLNRPYFGLYLPRRIWRELLNFSSGGICLVLASEVYDECDYYRDYDAFVRDARALRGKD